MMMLRRPRHNSAQESTAGLASLTRAAAQRQVRCADPGFSCMSRRSR